MICSLLSRRADRLLFGSELGSGWMGTVGAGAAELLIREAVVSRCRLSTSSMMIWLILRYSYLEKYPPI